VIPSLVICPNASPAVSTDSRVPIESGTNQSPAAPLPGQVGKLGCPSHEERVRVLREQECRDVWQLPARLRPLPRELKGTRGTLKSGAA
jgi:hypothetical protein